MRKKSKRYSENLAKVEDKKEYSLTEAVGVMKGFAPAKFDEAIEIVFNLHIDPKKAEQLVRGAFSLPHGIGKSVRVIAFCDGDLADKAKAAGAIEAGSDDLVKKISDGWADFDVAIAAPNMMAKVGRLGKVLGPRGLMPSPKSGTVTPNVEQAVKEFAAGKIEFRNDDTSNVHAVIGRFSFDGKQIEENAGALIKHIQDVRPQAVKEGYIKSVYIAPTMGPGLRIAV